ncbi:hypothetical protein KO465_02805 [Candidatus Micrarchaeota archaeon]|nr:hypothetical protein [Candidatus Micrarchaeota archaeon]
MAKMLTGIKGLDDMLHGGIPHNKNVALCGGPGCGKTLLSFEFLLFGAKQGEAGLFITLQESEKSILSNARATFSELSEDIQLAINDKKLIIHKPSSLDMNGLLSYIEKTVLEKNIKRVVIDSANVLKLNFKDNYTYRLTMQEFLIFLGNMECTMLVNYEVSYSERDKMKFNLEQFMADGIINVYNLVRQEKRIRALEILKMRGTQHEKNLVPFRITTNGIQVFVGENVY